MNFTSTGFPPDIEDQWKLTVQRLSEWVQDELFSVSWWLLMALFLFTAYLWWKTADKKRLSETVLFTASIVIIVIVLDELGEELSLWYYTVDIIPLFPPMTAIDISCLPLAYALVYRYAKTWKSFLITSAIMSVIFCFALEPLFVWAGVYKMITWKSWYGLPLYFGIGVVSKFIVRIAYRHSENEPGKIIRN